MPIDQDRLTRWQRLVEKREGSAYDGDGVYGPNGNQRLRHGDTPERAGREVPVDMPGAEPARQALQQALDSGAQVQSTGATGRHGRELVDVVDDQGNVGQDMIRRGLAAPNRESMNFMHLGVVDQATGNRVRPEWDRYVEQSDRENLDFLRNRFENLLAQPLHTRTRGMNRNNAAEAAFGRGVDNLQSSLYGFAEVLGKTTGIDALEKWGEDGMLRNMTEAALNPARIANYEEALAGGYEGVGLYVLETLIENAPQLAVDIGAALATGAGSMLVAGVGKAAMRKLAGSAALAKSGQIAKGAFSAKGVLLGRAGTVGMGTSIEAQMVGETRQQQFGEGLEDTDGALLHAWGVGSAKAALELASLETILRRVMKGGSADAAKELADTLREAGKVVRLRDIAGKAMQTGGVGFMAEGTTEMLQQFMDELSIMELDPNRELDLDNVDLTQVLDAGIRGGIFGGAIGTTGATVSGLAGMRRNLRREVNERQRKEHNFNPEATDPDPVSDLEARAKRRGSVWLAPANRGDEAAAVAAFDGEVFRRESEDGSLYLTNDPNDPLLDSATPLTGDALARARGFTPKSELNPEQTQQVVHAVDAEGNTLEAAVTDEDNLERTVAAVAQANPDADIRVRKPEDVLAERQARRQAERGSLDGLAREQADAQVPEFTLDTAVLGDLGQSPAREAQAKRRAPSEPGTPAASVYNAEGKLRPVDELMADLQAGRLDVAELNETLNRLGIDPARFQKTVVPVDRERTREAIRKALSRNKKLAAKYARTPHGTSFELADRAVAELDNASDAEWRKAAKDAGVELVRNEALMEGGRKYLMPRLKAKLRGDLPKPVLARAVRRYVGEGGSVNSLINRLPDMDDNSLIGLAEVLGAKVNDLTEQGEKTLDDVRGLFRELDDRAKKMRTNFVSQTQLEEEIPFGLEAQAPQTGNRVLDRQIQAEKQSRRAPTAEEAAEAEAEAEAEARTLNPARRAFITQSVRDLSVIQRLAGLVGLGLDTGALESAYWARHWPHQTEHLAAPVALLQFRSDIDAIRNAANPADIEQRLRHLIRYMTVQFEIPLDQESRAEEQLAEGLRLLAANHRNNPEQAIIDALSENLLIGDVATEIESELRNAYSNSGTPQAESYPSAQERDPQEQSDLVFYRTVNQATLKLPQFLEARSEALPPEQWSEAEKDYQQIRGQFMADPVAFNTQYRDRLLTRLAELNAATFTNELTQFTTEGEARARTYTNKARGQNLLLIEYSGMTGPVFKLVDAVTLANYAKDRHPVTAAEAITNLESNLARLAQGPESSHLERMKAAGLPQVADDIVVWFDPDGAPVTAGEARTQREQGKARRSKTAEAAALRDQASEELQQLEDLIELTLSQMRSVAEDAGDAETVAALADITANVNTTWYEQREARRSGTKRIETRLQQARIELREARDHLEEFQNRMASGPTRLTQRDQERILKRRHDRVAEAEARLRSLRDEEVSANRRSIDDEKATRDQVARLIAVDFGHGVIGSLKSLLDQRLSLLGKIKRLSAAVQDGAGEMTTSLRGWQAELADRQADSRNDIDEEGFDRQMAEMASSGESSLQIEGELYEEADGFVPDPMDQSVFRNERGAELSEVEAAVAFEAEQLAESESRFVRLSAPMRGMQLPLDAGLTEVQAEQPQAPRPRKAKKNFTGTKVRGRAAKRQSFQALAGFTRRLLLQVSKGMKGEQRTRFLQTPITLVETGDLAELERIARDAGHLVTPKELAKLAARPGYINLGPTVVISMDALQPGTNPAEWSLVFGHELGHMLYDQSWHLLPEAERNALFDLYQADHGWSYNGKEGFTGFKEWFADQMSAAIAKDVTGDRRSQYLDAKGVLGKALRFVIDNLKRMWDAIQSDKAVRRLSRFKLNLKFDEFARRILRGEMPLSHRYNVGSPVTMHYTPDEKPLPPSGVDSRIKRTLKGMLRPTGLYRSVIGRIRSANPELAGMLFQSANQTRVGQGSYEQKRNTLANSWAAHLQRAFDQIKKGRGQQAAVDQAYTEMREGKDTEGARILRKTIDTLLKDAQRQGWSSGQFMNGFTPYVFDHTAVEAKRGELMAMAKEVLPGATDEELNQQIDRIIEGYGIEELGHEPMGPGKPVGTHEAARTLILAIGPEKLAEAGFLLDKGFGMLQHLAAGLAKRTAWESTFGGYVTKDGKYLASLQASAQRAVQAGEQLYYDPNIKYKEALRAIEGEKGVSAAREVKDLVSGALGHNNLGVNKWARKSQEWATGVINLMILGFSGVASIPEPAIAAIRAGFGFNDIVQSLRNYSEAKHFAHAIGAAMTTGAEQAMRESMGEGYQSGILSKANNLFFTVNGQQFITRLSRTVGTAIGMHYVLKAAADGDYASLAKLGLTPEQVLQWNRLGRPPFAPDMEGPNAELARTVSAGISQFVNEGTLNPNKFQATNWGNNPYMKLIWHLKQFLWTFGDTVLMGVGRQIQQQVRQAQAEGYSLTMGAMMSLGTPMLAMALMMPLAMLSLGLRGLLAGQDRFDEDWDELVVELTRKTGAFAQWDLLYGLWQAHDWDQGLAGYAGAVTPALSVTQQILAIDNGQVDVSRSLENLKGMAPLVGQFKGVWQWLLE